MATTRHPTTPRVTPGLELGIGSVAVVVLTIMLASAPLPLGMAGLAIATIVGAVLIPDWRYSLGLAVITYFLFVGFIAGDMGVLSWRGHDALWQFVAFGLAYIAGLVLRWLMHTPPPD
ncbi:hypothetical protein SAMN05421812_12244 [Asanoa hainanensis]|uniref:Uncharacterized protein n=1 Tax=Asanoa hainanensis TaxID=560556 RepID=A0A239PEB6_9ACTN|nr:hypothetical protein [Asanoa hainanensis]SNT65387.1 hypothetical protein SAMN05421812_12244 [Asanoa hainanensis]